MPLMISKFRITNLVYCFVAIVISLVVILYQPINPLSYDVFGYYMYLPLKYKYDDIAIRDFSIISEAMNHYHISETFYQAVKWENENWVMRYPIGLSVLFFPFYVLADVIAPYTNYPDDGFSKPYQLCILYGSLFYALLGLYFVKKTLCYFFNDKVSAITLLAISLGTNFFFHVSIHGQGTMSHNFVFTLYAIIIYLTIRWHEAYKWKYIVFLGIATGLIALCRPTEIISVMIPLFYGITNKESLIGKIKVILSHKFQIALYSLIIIGIGFIQFGYWYSVSGEFIINPYGAGNPGEGLELLQPHIPEVLFSFRKGWFIYTPLMILTVSGFWHMYKHNKALFVPVFIYFIVNLYIISCWSCWWYGACFGVRSLVPSYALLCLPLGYFVYYSFSSKLKWGYWLFALFCILLNLFQSWQLSAGIIDDSNMSRAYYFSTFLQRTTPTNEQKKLLLKGKFSSGIEIFTKEDSLTHALAYERHETFEQISDKIKKDFLTDSIKYAGKYSLVTGTENPFSPSLESEYRNISKKSYTWIKATVWAFSRYSADSLKGELVVFMKHKGYSFKYKSYHISNDNFKPNVWNKLEYYYLTPDDLRSKKDYVVTFFWNTGNKKIYIDNLTLESYEPIVDKSVF